MTVTAEDAEDRLLIVQDQSAGFRVVCRQIDLFENVEPLLAAASGEEPRQRPGFLAKASS